MTRRRLVIVAALSLVLSASSPGGWPFVQVHAAVTSLPDRLHDRDFWNLVSKMSEPDGYFRSDNLLSNEIAFPHVIPDLIRAAKPGRVYLGVGPEQNFNYIAALKPQMAFIIDIRRGNLDLHLMYKALFELSADRADFVSRLFSKKRPDGLGRRSTPQEIFSAYSGVEKSEALYNKTLKDIQDHLARHRFALSTADLPGIEYVYHAFYTYGPDMQYASSQGGYPGTQPTYADLMIATDGDGQTRSYLATEENFLFVKQLERKNLLVPLVGNFGGPKTVREVGQYLTEHGATVSAFYLSNVEQFLGGGRTDFCRSVATMPLDETSTFIRAVRGGRYGNGVGFNFDLGAMAAEVKDCR